MVIPRWVEREQRQELRRVGPAVSGCAEWAWMEVESFLCNGSLFFFHRRFWRSWCPAAQHFQRWHRRRHDHLRVKPHEPSVLRQRPSRRRRQQHRESTSSSSNAAAVVVKTDLEFPRGLPPLVELKRRAAWAHLTGVGLSGEARRRGDGELLRGRVLRCAGEALNHCPEVGGVSLDESGVLRVGCLGVLQCGRRRSVGKQMGGGGVWRVRRRHGRRGLSNKKVREERWKEWKRERGHKMWSYMVML